MMWRTLLCRPRKKMLHGVLHATAASCIVLSAVAAFKSHSLKLPQPIPDLYSAHSWMGLATLALLGTQVSLRANRNIPFFDITPSCMTPEPCRVCIVQHHPHCPPPLPSNMVFIVTDAAGGMGLCLPGLD